VQNRNPLLDDPIFRRFSACRANSRSRCSARWVRRHGRSVRPRRYQQSRHRRRRLGKNPLADKREFEAEIVLKDSRTDLAVLRLKDTKEKFATLDFANSDEPLVGDACSRSAIPSASDRP
jgi:hypothetical protein